MDYRKLEKRKMGKEQEVRGNDKDVTQGRVVHSQQKIRKGHISLLCSTLRSLRLCAKFVVSRFPLLFIPHSWQERAEGKGNNGWSDGS